VEILHICVRSTLPWHDEAAVGAALAPELRQKVELWNACFSMRYAAFRVRLKEIAQENLARVENAKISRREEIPEGAWVAPVDDDDWFAPDLAQRLLAHAEPGLHGFHWSRYVLELPRRPRRWPWQRARRPADTSPHTCGSNNYAVRNLAEISRAGTNHVWASDYFDANLMRVKRVEASLSLQNRNLSSRSGLGGRSPTITRKALLERFRRHRRFYDRLRLPPDLAWAQPHVGAMAELMRSIRLR
jgi:hypothetical protein